MAEMLKVLEDIGLTHGEAKVYLALLETGQTTTGPIVKKSKISASKVYDILDRLMAKGLVSMVTKEKTKYFSATNPARLLDYMKEKEDEIKKRKKEVEEILPSLEKIGTVIPSQYAEVAFGFEGLKGLANKMLVGVEKGDEWIFWSFYTKDPEKFRKVYDFYREFDEDRKKKGLVVKGVVLKGLEKLIGKRRYAKICYVDFPTPLNISVCRDKVLFTPWEKEEVSYLVYSEQLADSFRGYFYSIFDKHYKKGK